MKPRQTSKGQRRRPGTAAVMAVTTAILGACGTRNVQDDGSNTPRPDSVNTQEATSQDPIIGDIGEEGHDPSDPNAWESRNTAIENFKLGENEQNPGSFVSPPPCNGQTYVAGNDVRIVITLGNDRPQRHRYHAADDGISVKIAANSDTISITHFSVGGSGILSDLKGTVRNPALQHEDQQDYETSQTGKITDNGFYFPARNPNGELADGKGTLSAKVKYVDTSDPRIKGEVGGFLVLRRSTGQSGKVTWTVTSAAQEVTTPEVDRPGEYLC